MDIAGKENATSKLKRIINSAACFVAAYVVITHGHFLMTAVVAKIFKYHSIVYYYGIRWMTNGERWTKASVTVVFLAGPLSALLFGLLCLYMYDKIRSIKSIINLFFIWAFVIGTSLFCSQNIIASLGMNEYNSPYYQNFAVLYAWWRIPLPLAYLANIPFAMLLLYFGVNYSKLFLLFAYSYTKVNKLSRKRKYFFETAIIPFLIGAVVTTIVTFPMNIFVHGIYLLVIAVALVVSFLSISFLDIMRDEVLRYKNLQEVSIGILVFTALLNALVFVTWRGVNI
jgi:hypothetical protein